MSKGYCYHFYHLMSACLGLCLKFTLVLWPHKLEAVRSNLKDRIDKEIQATLRVNILSERVRIDKTRKRIHYLSLPVVVKYSVRDNKPAFAPCLRALRSEPRKISFLCTRRRAMIYSLTDWVINLRTRQLHMG